MRCRQRVVRQRARPLRPRELPSSRQPRNASSILVAPTACAPPPAQCDAGVANRAVRDVEGGGAEGPVTSIGAPSRTCGISANSGEIEPRDVNGRDQLT